ncbi:alpha-N-arabinofuranosidase [Vallitalea guaymasensis]|uniref:non-reducing end alpha-L-arabinofuranosidase n=1 Tax=Vallitalea guaymasensis TaxID=1185412 RepID=A0A8J8SCS5_9FIRM|nr:alpha-N-arabinofuranosidase [Vallitalea guaymasensis]QUH29725.1 alpha-N-arabinofuranosidase [Vallitalea guaymasensis]
MVKYVINASKKKSQISKHIYGHFSEHLGRCIYGGIWVGEESDIPNTHGCRNDVVEALKNINIPVLRWPGGCFADEYHWKDGIGPVDRRKKMINTNWGGVVEDNSFGTHEFLEFCELIGAEPYICGNLGSGTVQEMSEWVEYMTSDSISPMADLRKSNGKENPWKVKYFGVGNENWGCGGNMRAEYYADEYRRYASYVKDYSSNKIFKVACGPSADDYNWTEVLMERACKYMQGLALHYYTIIGPWENKGSATDFSEIDYYRTMDKTLYMEELLIKHSAIMDKYDPDKNVALLVDEWGSWYDVEPGTNPGFLYQQNTMRDAMIAGINLNLFNQHSDRVHMANIAQLVNVLQAIILTEGRKMILTPTYHVFDMYKVHQDNTLVESYINTSEITSEEYKVRDLVESVSLDENNKLYITICNTDLHNPKLVNTELIDYTPNNLEGKIITEAMNAHNTFDAPQVVAMKDFNDVILNENGFTMTLPPCSIVRITLE